MIWGVLDISPNAADFAFSWVLIRLIQRSFKHFYNIYVNMGLRFEVIYLDYIRFYSFYLLIPVELLLSYQIILNSYSDIE